MTTSHPEGALAGRTGVVTGASDGIGAATTEALVGAGARVALLGRQEDRLQAVAERAGAERALVVPTDVLDRLQLADALDAVNDRFGPVDLVVAAAGVLTGAPFENSIPAEWAATLDVNLTGLLNTIQTFARDLLAAAESGRSSDLFLIGGVAGPVGPPGFAVYSAVEAAVAQLSRTLRTRHREAGPARPQRRGRSDRHRVRANDHPWHDGPGLAGAARRELLDPIDP